MKKTLLLGVALAGVALPVSRAAILTAVPMQGSMVMPMVSYRASTDSIQVMMPMEVPQLTPLLISNPNDRFDPVDPWFDALDPSRQGASFSKRYGFVMHENTDLLPDDRTIWIRKISASPELRVYRNANKAPKAWDPIFGTEGTPDALYWNGLMFHPAFTAPPGTRNLTATFEVYVVNTTTGLEVPDSSSGPLQFDWTNVSDGRPLLELSPGLVAWPVDTTTNWVLECASNPFATLWTTVTNAPVMVDGKLSVVLEGSADHEFFRMRHVP